MRPAVRQPARSAIDWPVTIGAALCALLPVGCSKSDIKTVPVQGRVQIKDGDVAILAGSNVELMKEGDELLRPSGKISPDGQFTLQTLYKGKLLAGAPEGKYKARIILGDESDEGVPKRKGVVIHRRFLDFANSGLSITVPSSDYTLVLARQ